MAILRFQLPTLKLGNSQSCYQRDSALVSHLFDERDEAVKRKLQRVIACAKQTNRKIGICGQAPSDYPEFAQFLVEQGIDSISLNPDSVLKTRLAIAKTEATILK